MTFPTLTSAPRAWSILLLAACLSVPVSLVAAPSYKTGERATVLIFTSTDCPVANALLPEIMRLHQAFSSQGVAFTLVHVDPDTTLEKARDHARSYSITVPFILDPKHDLVKRFKASRTPEAFVLRADGRIAYHGRINDLYHAPGQRRRSPTTHDLRDALGAVLGGRKVASAHQPAVGCVIADFER